MASEPTQPPEAKIFVGGLHWHTTAETLCAYFGSRFGEVTDAYVLTDKLSGKSRGFAFVTFADHAHAEAACAASQASAGGGDGERGDALGEGRGDADATTSVGMKNKANPLEIDGR